MRSPKTGSMDHVLPVFGWSAKDPEPLSLRFPVLKTVILAYTGMRRPIRRMKEILGWMEKYLKKEMGSSF